MRMMSRLTIHQFIIRAALRSARCRRRPLLLAWSVRTNNPFSKLTGRHTLRRSATGQLLGNRSPAQESFDDDKERRKMSVPRCGNSVAAQSCNCRR